jgi:HEAT repeat protein
MKDKVKYFLKLDPSEQAAFLEKNDFVNLERENKITFLKTILNEKLSSNITASALILLKELKYKDKFFFKKFLYHIDSSVSNAARKAIEQKMEGYDSECIRLRKMLQEGDTNDRLLLVNYFLGRKGKLNENALISFLSFDDLKVRETIIKKISMEHELDEARLSDKVKSGVVWYVRAALVEILGKRKSNYLLDIVDYLIEDGNVEVKLKLIDALLKLEKEKVKDYIRRLSDDATIWVRKKACRALETM